jgi:hypothetical protein
MSHDLTRWIEAAEERRFSEAVAFERAPIPTEHHFMHLGDAIAHLPSWLRRGVSGETLASIGCQAVAFVRRPLEHRHH